MKSIILCVMALNAGGAALDTLSNGSIEIRINAAQEHPQWLSTDRHVMQGYVDLIKKPLWDPSTRSLSAVSELIENEPYGVVIALNGYRPVQAQANSAWARISVCPDDPKLANLVIESATNARVNWRVTFAKHTLPIAH